MKYSSLRNPLLSDRDNLQRWRKPSGKLLPLNPGANVSEQGWKGFLAAEGVGDWVVLHGGATAVFRVGSLGDAAHLAEAVAKTPSVAGRGILLTAADDRLTVRLSRDIWQLEPEHVQIAHAISAVARERGAIPDRAAVQEVQVAIAAKQGMIDVNFWRAVLGYAPMADDNAIDPLGHGIPRSGCRRSMKSRHYDMRCTSTYPSRMSTLRRDLKPALAAGGRIVDLDAPSHWTLADRSGNRVCICAWPEGSTR